MILMSPKQTICNRCVMDNTAPNITFTKNGCNFCKSFFIEEQKIVFKGEKGRKKLENIFTNVKKEMKNHDYDAVAGVSGGVDSSYAIYIAKKYDLRVLMVHVDNGWNTKIAEKNIQALKQYTSYDLKTVSPPFDEFLDLQKAYIKAGVINIEAPSDLVLKAVNYKTAEERNVPFLLQGNNWNTEGLKVSSWGYPNDDLRNLKGIHNKFGTKTLKNIPLINRYKYSYYREKFNRLTPLNFVDYNPDEAKSILIEKVPGWADYGIKHGESIWTKFYQAYILPKKFGIDKRKMHYSSRICAGQMTREQALKKLEDDPYPEGEFDRDFKIICEKFGMTNEEFKDFLFSSPIVPHEKYGTDRFLRKITPFLLMIRNPLYTLKKAFKKIF